MTTDTDSIYYSYSGDNIIDVVRPEMKEDFLNRLSNHCNDDFNPVKYGNVLPRNCCSDCYIQKKNCFSYLYLKRHIQEDGLHTSALTQELCNLPDYNLEIQSYVK